MSVTMKEMSKVKSSVMARLSTELDQILQLEVVQSGMNKEPETTTNDLSRFLFSELHINIAAIIDQIDNDLDTPPC